MGKQVPQEREANMAIKCLWTWFHCASKKSCMFTNNFLKVHFKLKLLFSPLRKNTYVFLHQFFES